MPAAAGRPHEGSISGTGRVCPRLSPNERGTATPGIARSDEVQPRKSGALTFMRRQLNIPILMYHSISDHASARFRSFAVPVSLFAEQMARLQSLGYTALTITQLVGALVSKKNALPERPVAITFDDGFADVFSEALPILQRHGSPRQSTSPQAILTERPSGWRPKERPNAGC